ncbi:Dead-box atp-dependent rna helicase 58 protein, partial [Thalictrum thalictroides]
FIAVSCVANTDADISQKNLTLREICQGHVPEHILLRAEEVGFVEPTDVQREALPMLLSGRDCILHAQVTFLRCF